MYWEHPQILLALWLLPLLVLVLARDYFVRRRLAEQFVGRWLADRLVTRPRGVWQLVKGATLVTGLALLIVAAARPRFGESRERVTARGIDLVILLDVSRSMLAEDVGPNRLRRATSDIRDLLPKLQGDRVGLVAFAGTPVVRVPLTTDQAFFRQVLERIDADSVPRGGSAIGDAILKALEILPPAADRDQALLLITDGEDHESAPLRAALLAAERNVKLFAVGLGDAEQGSRIPVRDERGQLRYLQHEGREVWSKVDRRLLTELALKTGGAYVPAHTRNYDLGRVYEDHLKRLTRGELASEIRNRYREQFPLFLWLGLSLLLLEALLPGYSRVQELEAPSGPATASPATPSPVAASPGRGAQNG